MQSSLSSEETLFFTIDFQEKLMPAMGNKEDLLKNAVILIQIAKALKCPIIVTEQYPKGLGKTQTEILELIEAKEVIEKNTFSACTEEVHGLLKDCGRQKIIVSGIETHICVFQTVRDLIQWGYEVYVVEDAVSSRKAENKANALALMRDMGAVVMNTETLLFDLLKSSLHPEFKNLSKLIK